MAQGKVQLTCPYCGYQDEEREFAYSDFAAFASDSGFTVRLMPLVQTGKGEVHLQDPR